MTKTTPMMEVTRRYGHTVYTISAFGSPESACTYEERLLNLIQHEADKMDSCNHGQNIALVRKLVQLRVDRLNCSQTGRSIRDVVLMHNGQQPRAVAQTLILSIGLYAGSKDVGRELKPQALPGHILALSGQQLVLLFLVLRPCIEPGQPRLQLTEQFVLLTALPVLFTNLRGNAALLHSTGIRPFVYHGDALHSLVGIALRINKALRESSFTQGFVDGSGSSGAPTFCIATIIPIGCVNLSCFPAAFLLGRDTITVSIQDVLQSALVAPLAIWCQWAHGQQDVSVWVAITFVVKGDICTHSLVYKKLFYGLKSKRKENHDLSLELSVRIESYEKWKKYQKHYRTWEKLPEAKRGGFERKYEYELRQYRQAASVLRRCQDDGEKIDYKGWKKALDYLNKEQFVLDYQLEDMKEEVRRLEVVKREFIQENKKKKAERYAR